MINGLAQPDRAHDYLRCGWVSQVGRVAKTAAFRQLGHRSGKFIDAHVHTAYLPAIGTETSRDGTANAAGRTCY
jgi:hypothetical protein